MFNFGKTFKLRKKFIRSHIVKVTNLFNIIEIIDLNRGKIFNLNKLLNLITLLIEMKI